MLEQHDENCITEPTKIKMSSEKDKCMNFEKKLVSIRSPVCNICRF